MKKIGKSKDALIVLEYVESVLSGEKIACPEIKKACQRFVDDLDNPAWDFRPKSAESGIRIIESLMVFDKGERLNGEPLVGKPFELQPFEKFHLFNLLGFYEKGQNIRRFKEAFIMVPRKNDKTRFIGGLAVALGIIDRKAGSTIYITSAALKQSLESFNFILHSVRKWGLSKDEHRIMDNNNEHSVEIRLPDGYLKIIALAANPDKHDSFNCNIGIADEIHAFKSPKQYTLIRDAMKSYSNKLMMGITTAGDNVNSFCYRRYEFCQKVLDKTVEADYLYVFIAKAPEGENGDVDYTNPVVHEMANPSYGVIIRPDDIMNQAIEAQNDPQQRKDFLSKSLNVYTSAMESYFNLAEFVRSNDEAEKALGIDPDWSLKKKLDHLRRLNIDWYGGTDLSKVHDLTAASLKGSYNGIDIAITHSWFPITEAHKKAEEDSIPLFGWADDGWLTMINAPTVDPDEVVKWYKAMRAMGFKIRQVGHDRKFAREYFLRMKAAGFSVIDQPQTYWNKSEGFRRIEAKVKNRQLYYLGSEAYEYCVSNVKAIEKSDDQMAYEKVEPTQRIDIFDADVFATCRLLQNMERKQIARGWFD